MYPLGSCTMKYNPKVNEVTARTPGLADIHPYQPPETAQGALELIYELEALLATITGFRRSLRSPPPARRASFADCSASSPGTSREGRRVPRFSCPTQRMEPTPRREP